MTVDQMRAALLQVYPGPGWQVKVLAMHDNQIIAIYAKFKKEGRLKS